MSREVAGVERKMARAWIAVVSAGVAAVLWGGVASADDLLVTSFNGDRVNRFDLASGASKGTLAAAGGLDGPLCTRIGPDGRLYVASEANNSIMRFNAVDGTFIDTFVAAGSGGLAGPTGVTWGPDGHLYVSSFNSDSVLKFDGVTGASMGTFVQSGAGSLDGPDNGTIFGPDGNLYVPSYWNNRVLKYSGATGEFLGTFIAGIGRPRVLEFRDDGLYVSSETLDTVRRYDAATGAFIANFITPRAGGLDEPCGFAFGPDGYLYVSSLSKNQVLRYDGKTGAFAGEYLGAADGVDTPVFLTVIPAPGPAACLGAGTMMMAVRRRR